MLYKKSNQRNLRLEEAGGGWWGLEEAGGGWRRLEEAGGGWRRLVGVGGGVCRCTGAGAVDILGSSVSPPSPIDFNTVRHHRSSNEMSRPSFSFLELNQKL